MDKVTGVSHEIVAYIVPYFMHRVLLHNVQHIDNMSFIVNLHPPKPARTLIAESNKWYFFSIGAFARMAQYGCWEYANAFIEYWIHFGYNKGIILMIFASFLGGSDKCI